MTAEFQRENLLRLPLPLAQLYARANNAKDARSRHDHTFYLFEALVKLAAAPGIAAYVRDVRAGVPRSSNLDKALLPLALPSLGHWVAMLRESSRYFASRTDAATHPLGHVAGQLSQRSRDWPSVLALYRRIKNGPDGALAIVETCSLQELIDALVQYRNAVFGHGGPRMAAFYENEVGPLLFPALNEVLSEGRFDFLGPRGSRLMYLTEIRALEGDEVELGIRELVGLQGERTAPLRLGGALARGLAPQRVLLLWPGHAAPLRLDPLVAFREGEIADELLFLNRERNARHVEYLSYTTGRTERDATMATSLADLLSVVSGRSLGAADLDKLAEQTLSETPSLEAILGSEPTTATQLGDYEILGELGRGGMGVVYLAKQLSLGRLVAVKMLPADLAGDELALARFRREIRLLARCDHPHIVKVLASGVFPNGHAYYAMEYVPGCNLEFVWREVSDAEGKEETSSLGATTFARAVISASQKQRGTLKPSSGFRLPSDSTDKGVNDRTENASSTSSGELELRLPPLPEVPSLPDDAGGYTRRVAELVRDAASAVQAMHDQELIHRDIKPANLMLTPDGSRVVLMDFGLAKSAGTRAELTQQGGFLGTLRYAAPEQMAAAKLRVGPAADVRALGVTLWELLSRQRAFGDAQDEVELARRVHDDDLPPLRTIDLHFSRDLEAIVARATERRVSDRIATAGEMAQYLRLYLEGKPIPIRTLSASELLWRWVGEHKPLVYTSAAALVSVLAILVISMVMIMNSARIARDALEENLTLEMQRSKAMITSLEQAPAEAVPTLLQGMEAIREKIKPSIESRWMAQGLPDPQRVRLALARLPYDESVNAYLQSQFLLSTPADSIMIRNALKPRGKELAESFWQSVESLETLPEKRLRAASALAEFDPENSRWNEIAKPTVAAMLASNPFDWPIWIDGLRPAREHLLPALSETFRDRSFAEHRYGAAVVCADYAADRPEILSDLVADAEPRQFEVLLPRLRAQLELVVPILEKELTLVCEPDWGPALNNDKLKPLDADTVKQIEQSEGMLTDAFAFCATLSRDKFKKVNDDLLAAGYSLSRLRPYAVAGSVQIAGKWDRDGHEVEHLLDASAEEIRNRDEVMRAKGLLPVDVAGYLDAENDSRKPLERYAVVWQRLSSEDSDRELVVGSTIEPEVDGVSYLGLQGFLAANGKSQYCTLAESEEYSSIPIWKRETASYVEMLRRTAHFVQQDVRLSVASSSDAILRATAGLIIGSSQKDFSYEYAAIFSDLRDVVSTELHNLTPTEHLPRARELESKGWRPWAISVLSPFKKPLVVASVWHHPLITDERKEKLAHRQALAAAALMLLGRAEKTWPLFRHTTEPRARSWLIHSLATLSVPPEILIEQLDRETNVSAQRALWLALGELSDKLDEDTRAMLGSRLEKVYREHADSGLHAAAEWTLRRLDRVDAVERINRELASQGPAANRSWYTNQHGLTMAIFPGPVEFVQGSPKGEFEQDIISETPIPMRIGRTFAMATKEVTLEQFQEFANDHPIAPIFLSGKYTPDPQCPIISLTWFNAAKYCRWLSEKEGIPEEEMCYPPVRKIKDGMKLPADYLQRTGYRLPTEAEWEFACRAGSTTSRYYGSAEELLGKYSHYVKNSNDRTWSVGLLKPNDFGLFDMHGNIWEWCHEGVIELPSKLPEALDDREEANLQVTAGQFRMVRGGSFDRNASHIRSASRLRLRTTDDYLIVGLRVARTLPNASP
jgi:formylglycine-generating enzyme required for sulfatase activity/serine/threonine protein kinase